MLQLALLILGILIIVGVIFNALRERRRDSIGSARWTPPNRSNGAGVGKGLPLGDQMDIFGSAAGEFDEFGVGRPRKVKEDEAEAVMPPASRPVEPSPRAAPVPEATPAAPNPVVDSPVSSKSRKVPTMTGDRDASQAAPPASAIPLSGGLLRTPSGDKAAADQPPAAAASSAPAAAAPAPECVVVLFVAEREGKPLPGTRIHAALKAQSLTSTPEKIYQRGAGDDVSFSIASLIKPGALDPAEAARFASPGLTLYLTVPGPRDPVAALEDLLITSDRLAGALDGDVFDQERQPLTAATRTALRQKIAAAVKAA